MEKDDMIRIDMICSGYNVEPSFIDSLFEAGLIEIITIENTRFVSPQRISDLEKMIRFHYEMEINLPGIETIVHLLERMSLLQEELNELRNKIRFYEIE